MKTAFFDVLPQECHCPYCNHLMEETMEMIRYCPFCATLLNLHPPGTF